MAACRISWKLSLIGKEIFSVIGDASLPDALPHIPPIAAPAAPSGPPTSNPPNVPIKVSIPELRHWVIRRMLV